MTVFFSTIPGEHRWHLESGWYNNNNNTQPGSGDVDGGNGMFAVVRFVTANSFTYTACKIQHTLGIRYAHAERER
jgi:hypothetical protein